MKAPVKWLLSYTDVKAETREEIHELASEMTLSGSKVETVDEIGGGIERVVVGLVKEVKPHENSDHLQICQLKVDDTDNLLQIVTGAPNVRVGGYIPAALDNSTIAGGAKIKNGKLRGVDSFGMMCSFEELGLDYHNYEGGIGDGLMILQDLKMFEGLKTEDFDKFIGKDIMDVLGVKETVIDYEITSNRPDCFSIIGLAREAAATMETLAGKSGHFAVKTPIVREEGTKKASDFIKVKVDAPDLCPRYMARVVTDVKIAPSPEWMQKRLMAAGVRAINNIVDITNYVMLEYGQPMHAFDYRTVRGGEICVRRAQDGEKLTTLDDVERTLDSSMLVIADKEGAIAVAGVMGGQNSEICEDTPAIVFESAIFDGVTVRRGAKKIGLRTEASSRFEKGLDQITAAKALERAAELVEELGAGKVCKGVIDVESVKKLPRKVECSVDGINHFIGIHASKADMEHILEILEVEPHFDEGYVIPPSFRDDLKCDADIAEEVARFYGYNKIESRLLNGCEATLGERTREQELSDKVRRAMIGLGFNEMLSFSFHGPSVFDKMHLENDDPLRDAVVITNPLGEEFSIMRTSMIPSILDAMAVNQAHRVDLAKLFEISYVYIKTPNYPVELPEHRELLTFAGYCNTSKFTFFDFKGILEALLGKLHVSDVEFEPASDIACMHPGRTAKVMIAGKYAGFIGSIHPAIAAEWDVPSDTYVACIETKALYANAVDVPKNREIPKFPATTRDIAVVLAEDVPAGHVAKLIRERGGKILESCTLFDCYVGAQVGEGKKSLAYSLSFRANDRTLTDEEVGKAMKKILNGLEFTFQATLRE